MDIRIPGGAQNHRLNFKILFSFLTHEVGQNSFGPTSHARGTDVYQIIKIHTRNYVESFISVCILCGESTSTVSFQLQVRESTSLLILFVIQDGSETILFLINW